MKVQSTMGLENISLLRFREGNSSILSQLQKPVGDSNGNEISMSFPRHSAGSIPGYSAVYFISGGKLIFLGPSSKNEVF